MALPTEPYFDLLVHCVEIEPMSGRHGTVHVRPVRGQGVDPDLYVECKREMRTDFPVGTMFLVRAKFSNKLGGQTFLKAPHAWGYSKVSAAAAARFIKSLRGASASDGIAE